MINYQLKVDACAGGFVDLSFLDLMVDWAATTFLANSTVLRFSMSSSFFLAIISSWMDIWATLSIRDSVCRDILYVPFKNIDQNCLLKRKYMYVHQTTINYYLLY